MRKKVSLVFYCLASVLILLQLGVSVGRVVEQQGDAGLIHVVSVEETSVNLEQKDELKLDFSALGKELEQDNY